MRMVCDEALVVSRVVPAGEVDTAVRAAESRLGLHVHFDRPEAVLWIKPLCSHAVQIHVNDVLLLVLTVVTYVACHVGFLAEFLQVLEQVIRAAIAVIACRAFEADDFLDLGISRVLREQGGKRAPFRAVGKREDRVRRGRS